MAYDGFVWTRAETNPVGASDASYYYERAGVGFSCAEFAAACGFAAVCGYGVLYAACYWLVGRRRPDLNDVGAARPLPYPILLIEIRQDFLRFNYK